MPFCPVCRVEYRKGFTHCVDCGEFLLESLESLPIARVAVDGGEGVLLCAITDDYKADMIAATLQDQGVPVLIKISGPGHVLAVTGAVALESKELYVPSYLEDEAREVLNGMVLIGEEPQPDDAAVDGVAASAVTEDSGIQDKTKLYKRPYKATEDRRGILAIVFGAITVAYVIFLYMING